MLFISQYFEPQASACFISTMYYFYSEFHQTLNCLFRLFSSTLPQQTAQKYIGQDFPKMFKLTLASKRGFSQQCQLNVLLQKSNDSNYKMYRLLSLFHFPLSYFNGSFPMCLKMLPVMCPKITRTRQHL
uniref:Uncharacterized protein n=1 Tax=Rhipicephalus microplus TaxID=6941 RepID=A0A6G5AHH0_RHIMP